MCVSLVVIQLMMMKAILMIPATPELWWGWAAVVSLAIIPPGSYCLSSNTALCPAFCALLRCTRLKLNCALCTGHHGIILLCTISVHCAVQKFSGPARLSLKACEFWFTAVKFHVNQVIIENCSRSAQTGPRLQKHAPRTILPLLTGELLHQKRKCKICDVFWGRMKKNYDLHEQQWPTQVL